MTDPTVAYQRPTRPPWRHRAERWITKLGDTYQALWDVMPAIAAFAFLLWLTSWWPHR